MILALHLLLWKVHRRIYVTALNEIKKSRSRRLESTILSGVAVCPDE